MSHREYYLEPEESGLRAFGQGLNQKELEQLSQDLNHALEEWFRPGAKPERDWDKLMLHVCCGPCAEFPLAVLQRYGGVEAAVFSNPNIHPLPEYERRLEYARLLMEDAGIPFSEASTSSEERWRAFPNESKSAHCRACYPIRMHLAAAACAEHGCDAFTTTLAVSPYQNYELLTQAGHAAAKNFGVRFIELDFRPGYRIGQRMARADRLYRQRYCGCIYSLKESNYAQKIATDLNLTLADLPDRKP